MPDTPPVPAAVTPDEPAVRPPISPGFEPAAPRERAVPGRAMLPEPLRLRVARFDRVVDGAFDRLRGHPVADRLFYDATELADFSLIWHLTGVARGLLWPRRERETFRLLACLAVESALVNGAIKSLFRRARPVSEAHEHPRRFRRPRTSSFPSGHASAAFCAAGLLAEDDRAWPLYYGAAAVVSASRVHVRIHHASDVVAGAVVGAVLARVFRRVWPLR